MGDHHRDVLERLKAALGVGTLPELADALGETLGAVKSWSARGSVPLAHLVTAAEKSGSSLDWLVRGIEMLPASADAAPAGSKSAIDFAFAAKSAPAPGGKFAPAVAASPPAPAYHGPGTDDPDFGKRLAAAMDIIESGLAAQGVDATKVPRAQMAAEVYRLLPWPIPKAGR